MIVTSHSMDNHQGTIDQKLVDNVIGFSRYARENGFTIGLQDSIDCQRIAALIDITKKHQLRYAFKTLLCNSPADWERFDELFDVYWLRDKAKTKVKATPGSKAKRTHAIGQAGNQRASKASLDIPNANALAGQGAAGSDLSHEGASAIETLEKKDFNQLVNDDELKAMEMLAEKIARKIRRKILRRYDLNQRGKRINIRRTLRDSIQYGGLPFSLSYEKRRQQIPKLVVLLDVSRSMSVYSYLFLRFARGILDVFKQADAFAFHTRLLAISDVLREPSRERLAEKMALISSGWEGGTRIDKSLSEFNKKYASRVLNSRSILIIVSDGYDTGDAKVMTAQLRKIKKRARRIVWINPLLGLANYEPVSVCMQAALPLIDVFAPGNNLQSLEALETSIAKL